MLVINGDVGTGKTTVTAALSNLYSQQVVAFYFFSAFSLDRSCAKRFIMTIACQLCMRVPVYRAAVLHELPNWQERNIWDLDYLTLFDVVSEIANSKKTF